MSVRASANTPSACFVLQLSSLSVINPTKSNAGEERIYLPSKCMCCCIFKGSQGRNSDGNMKKRWWRRSLLASLLMFNYLSYIAQDHLPKDCAHPGRLEQLIIMKNSPQTCSQDNVISQLRFSSQVTLGCVKLIIKANMDWPTNIFWVSGF